MKRTVGVTAPSQVSTLPILGPATLTPWPLPWLQKTHQGVSWRQRGPAFPRSRRRQRLTFDPVTSVKGDLAVDLGLVWLDGDEESPRHCTVQLPPGPWVLKGREGVLVGTRSEGRPESGNRERREKKVTLCQQWPMWSTSTGHEQLTSKDMGGPGAVCVFRRLKRTQSLHC